METGQPFMEEEDEMTVECEKLVEIKECREKKWQRFKIHMQALKRRHATQNKKAKGRIHGWQT